MRNLIIIPSVSTSIMFRMHNYGRILHAKENNIETLKRACSRYGGIT